MFTIYDLHHPWIYAEQDKQHSYTKIAALFWSATIPSYILELLKHSRSELKDLEAFRHRRNSC
jgi:hypothetical protein